MLNKKLEENEVHLGVLAGQAKKVELVSSGKSGEIWQGIGVFESGAEIPIYFQILPSRELFTQCLSLLISRYIGLPTPNAGLVVVHPAHFPLKVTTKTTIAIATIRNSHPCLLRHITQVDESEPVYNLISKWSHLATAAALDEWLGVSTRPAGSFLMDGGKMLLLNSFPGAIAKDLAPDAYTINSLLLMLELQDRSELGKQRAKKQLHKSASNFRSTPLFELVDQMKYHIYKGEEHIDDTLDFLNARIEELSGLFDSAISSSQIPMEV